MTIISITCNNQINSQSRHSTRQPRNGCRVFLWLLFMEVLLLIVLVVGFVGNFFFMRYFFKRISDKLTFLSSETTSEIPSTPYSPTEMDVRRLFKLPKETQTDKPLPNQIGENEEMIDVNEQTFTNLPKDVKFEVEGGDTQTPPGFTEYKK